MTLARLALAYLARRPLATALVVALVALGVAMAALTLLVARELEERLERDARGVDLVVGAKGSPLQLVLAGVWHADVPPGNIPLASLGELRAHPLVASAIPLALGDSFRGFRIVGTEPALVEHYGAKLAAGAMFAAPMQAVLGSEVARATGLGVGGAFRGTHGLAEGGGEHGEHPYAVTGILAPTGTVADRLVYTPIESVWDVHASGEPADPAAREITLVLLRWKSPLAATGLAREINRSTALVAASPAYETARLAAVFGVGLDLVRAFAAILAGAAVLLLFVALWQSLDERRYDLAILRALGARPVEIGWILLVEGTLLAAIGTFAGLALAHLAAAAIGSVVPAFAPLAAAAWPPVAEEGILAAVAIGGGILAAALPAWRAARLDVAGTLARG